MTNASFVALLGPLLLAACSNATPAPAPPGTSADASAESSAASAQLPPTRGADVETWLATGAYKSWHCEPAVHAARSPSPHGMNRVCSNDAVAAFTGTGERPEGSAGVKEIYDAAGGAITGYSVYLKTKPDSAGGANWYWYERLGSSVVADGLGTSGAPKDVCVGCHAGAGTDAAHTPSPGGSDQVYTPVR